MIEMVIEQRRRDIGGFEVGRVLPYAKRRMVGPFIFFDRMGPVDFPAGIPKTVDVRPHPHIGLSTVTYLFDGEIMHRDSVGSEQAIMPGEVNWMTAAAASRTPSASSAPAARAGRMDGIQAWVALPDGLEETDPAFAHHGAADLPTLQEPGLWARLIAGRAFGAEARVKTHSPMFYVHWELGAGASAELPAEYPERAAYVARGEVEALGQRYRDGQMVVFAPGAPVLFTAISPARVMLLGGEPSGRASSSGTSSRRRSSASRRPRPTGGRSA
jgi:redox-sensitive bicupin YhaK (pirin superfamily)